MKKFGLLVMLAAMLAAPMLACGFPLPAGTSNMAVAKTVCAEGEAVETCQARQDAYQMMSQITSAVIPDLSMSLAVMAEGEEMEVQISGSYTYIAADEDAGLGAQIHARFDEGHIVSEGETQDISGAEFIVIGNMGYASQDGGESWTQQELDEDTINGLSMFLGLAGPTGSETDLYSDPASFSVAIGPDEEYNGQGMQVQTLTVNLDGLLANPDALGGLAGAAGEGLGEGAGTEELDPEMLADPMMAMMLGMMLGGTDFSTTLHIGQDDGLIHYVLEDHTFSMDLSMLEGMLGEGEGEEAPTSMSMTYMLSGHIEQHNAALVIEPPTNITGEGDFSSIFGQGTGVDLGGGLFGE